MPEPERVVLDASALLTWFDAEPGYRKVATLMRAVQGGKTLAWLSRITLMEVYARLLRHGVPKEPARRQLDAVEKLGVGVVEPEAELLMRAAELRAETGLPLLDAVAAETALTRGASLLTSDPDFRAVASRMKILWIR